MPNIKFILPENNNNNNQELFTEDQIIEGAAFIGSTVVVEATSQLLIKQGVSLLDFNEPDAEQNGGDFFSTNMTEFGTPFIGSITLCKGGQTFFNSNTLSGFTNKLEEVYIPTCLMTVNNNKTIVKTPIVGRDGTVKTYMSGSDYEINIEATIVASDDPSYLGSYNGIYPVEIIQNLIDICNAPCAISITSDYLNMFQVKYIEIDEYEIGQQEGSYSYQKITMKCVSEDPTIYNSVLIPKQ